jgi:uncharacterized protein (AIM24 family)
MTQPPLTAPAPASSYVCKYCRQPSDATASSCPSCGAPVDIRAAVSKSGWQRQPAIKDMARIQFGQSHVQIIGTLAPVADFRLAQGESIYFGHHRLVWSDPTTSLATLNMGSSWSRRLAGMPIHMMNGTGPGHIALSDNAAGEVIALPLQHGQGMWVREHRFLTAGSAVEYTYQPTNVWFVTGSGDDTETHYPLGQYGDVFTARTAPGLLLVHAPGNTFVRDLARGETLLVQPTSLIYCDLSVSMHLHMEYPSSSGGIWGLFRRYSYRTLWLRLVGPGRVAVQSVFEREEASESINRSSFSTTRSW